MQTYADLRAYYRSHRHALCGFERVLPPPRYAAQHAQTTCLMGWVDGCDVRAAVTALAAEYLLVETVWPAKEQEVGTTIQGVGGAYRLIHRLSPWKSTGNDMGRIWGAPDRPWEVTAQAPWLELAWQAGTTKVWKVIPQRTA